MRRTSTRHRQQPLSVNLLLFWALVLPMLLLFSYHHPPLPIADAQTDVGNDNDSAADADADADAAAVNDNKNSPVIICPTGVKICPNFVFVGRDPRYDCDFRPCPPDKSNNNDSTSSNTNEQQQQQQQQKQQQQQQQSSPSDATTSSSTNMSDASTSTNNDNDPDNTDPSASASNNDAADAKANAETKGSAKVTSISTSSINPLVYASSTTSAKTFCVDELTLLGSCDKYAPPSEKYCTGDCSFGTTFDSERQQEVCVVVHGSRAGVGGGCGCLERICECTVTSGLRYVVGKSCEVELVEGEIEGGQDMIASNGEFQGGADAMEENGAMGSEAVETETSGNADEFDAGQGSMENENEQVQTTSETETDTEAEAEAEAEAVNSVESNASTAPNDISDPNICVPEHRINESCDVWENDRCQGDCQFFSSTDDLGNMQCVIAQQNGKPVGCGCVAGGGGVGVGSSPKKCICSADRQAYEIGMACDVDETSNAPDSDTPQETTVTTDVEDSSPTNQPTKPPTRFSAFYVQKTCVEEHRIDGPCDIWQTTRCRGNCQFFPSTDDLGNNQCVIAQSNGPSAGCGCAGDIVASDKCLCSADRRSYEIGRSCVRFGTTTVQFVDTVKDEEKDEEDGGGGGLRRNLRGI